MKFGRLQTILERISGPFPIFIGAILESSIIPFPFELVLISTILQKPNVRRAFVLASAAVAGCLVGATAFYVIGQFAFDAIGLPLAHHLGIADEIANLEQGFNQHGFWIIAGVSFLPLPIQAATLASGAFDYSFPLFLLAILTSRALRFHGIAVLTVYAGRWTLNLFKRARS